MLSPLTPRPTLAALRGGPMLVALSLSALLGCAGTDEAGLDVLDESTPHEPAWTETNGLGQLQQPLFGSDTCRDVYVSVRNFLSEPITVRSIEYYNASEGRWQTEDLANRTLAADGGLEIWVENLEHAENDRIYSANLLYDHLDHTHDEHFDIPDRNCLAGIVLFDLFVE